ncbi:class I SAM-dependent methyltransferase [Clostridium botulinum]|uniref:Class I SAM-dependent methyltransferase n=1 Tax=Clostridium botulinum TaxID=1491 RepID=A0A6M0STX2_CLOBO|nr:class I SAM-dependent methyltransferase [Clostridium botulinum]NFI54712.1 class I SAM-dependent methyltransferase [Clostridium botulinum]NFO48629.1 class I SAM-dependent methyltransferase [Clostridium botulinum]
MSLLVSNHLKTGYSNYNLFFLKHYYQDLNLNNKILDVGCGHYRNLYLFYQLGFKELYGIDRLIPQPIELPKRFKANFIQKDIMQGLPYKEKEFDIVLCNYVLMFIPNESLSFVLKELLRITKVFCIIETQKQFYEAKKTQIEHYDFKEIVQLIQNNGEFEILHQKIYKEKLILRRKNSWHEEGNQAR